MAYIPEVVTSNDVFQITLRMIYNEQVLLNVFHMRPTEITNNEYAAWCTDLADELAAEFGGTGKFVPWLDNTSANVLFDEWRVQRIHPVRDVYFQSAITLNGVLAAGPGETPNIALSVTKRTLTPGRTGVGRTQLAGWEPGAIDAGVYSAGSLTAAFAAMDWQLLDFVTQAGNGGTWGLYNPGSTETPPFSRITSVIPQDTVRTMHRRTVRLGI